jgi:hypothetical protein
MDSELAALFIGETQDWISSLPPYQEQLVIQMLAGRDPVAVAVAWLSSTGPVDTAPFGAVRKGVNLFYDSVLTQIHKLLCGTTDYINERQSLLREARAGRTALVTAVSAIIAPHVGVSAALLAPPVALTFSVLSQAGNDAICGTLEQLIEDRRRQAEAPSGGTDPRIQGPVTD